ncbi:MAG: glycosyltransferase family 87 protein, partial [Acidimicrobiia bacterium]
AAVDGLDPYEDLQTLGQSYDVEFKPIGAAELGDIDRVHPRTPGALVFLLPLYLIPVSAAYPALLLVTVLATVTAAAFVFPRLADSGTTIALVFTVGLVGLGCFTTTLEFGTQSAVLMLAVGALLAGQRDSDSALSGVPLGVALTLRLFPGLLLIPLVLARRYRAVVAAILVFLASSAVGIVLFDVDLVSAVNALQVAEREWMAFSGNGSLAMPLAEMGLSPDVVGPTLAVVGLSVAWMIGRKGSLGDQLAVTLMVALLVSPLSWFHYDLLAVFVVIHLYVANRGLERDFVVPWALGVWLVLQLSAPTLSRHVTLGGVTSFGFVALSGRLVLLFAALRLYRSRGGDPVDAR